MRETRVSVAFLVTVIFRTPVVFRVPAKTQSFTFLGTGTDSPVTKAWSTCENPSITLPSKGILSPGLTRITVSGFHFVDV